MVQVVGVTIQRLAFGAAECAPALRMELATTLNTAASPGRHVLGVYLPILGLREATLNTTSTGDLVEPSIRQHQRATLVTRLLIERRSLTRLPSDDLSPKQPC